MTWLTLRDPRPACRESIPAAATVVNRSPRPISELERIDLEVPAQAGRRLDRFELRQPVGKKALQRAPGGRLDEQLAAFARYVFRPGSINVQGYTADQGGYPYWHCEQYPRDTQCEALHRVLLWMLYLNDNFDEGETEFLWQQRKVRPQTGAMVIAPAAFTHTHRGNRPRGGDKYIATSWVLFRRAEQLFPG